MKSRRHSFIKVMVIVSLFLLLFSALAISVLYIGQSSQNPETTTQSGFNINELIKAELSGNSSIINEAKIEQQVESGEAIILPSSN